MTRRALGGFGAATVLALALVGFTPHAALARAPDITWNAGTNYSTPVAISGQAVMPGSGRVDSVTVSVTSAEGHLVPDPQQTSGNDSNTLPFGANPVLTFNGTYTVKAEAVGRDGPIPAFDQAEASSISRTFTLNILPVAPSGVKATVSQTKRTITISWASNPEPDIIGYGVYRKDGATFVERKIATKDEKSYTDDLGSLPAGTYSYQVIAARSNAAGNGVLTSKATPTSGKVTSSPPPPPTSSTLAGGGTAATTTTAPGSKAPALAVRGKTDLSGFAALLPSGGAKLPAVPRSGSAPDPGFNEDLPFDSTGGNGATSASQNDSVEAAGGQTLASSNDDQPSGLRFMAAGLLVTVVLMHLLWLRDEVNREPLPVLVPEEPPDS